MAILKASHIQKVLKYLVQKQSKVIFCEADDWKPFYEAYGSHFEDIEIEMDRRNSAIPLKDLIKYECTY